MILMPLYMHTETQQLSKCMHNGGSQVWLEVTDK